MPLNRRLFACLFACLAASAVTQIPARADAPPAYSYAYLKDMRAGSQLPKLPDYTLDRQKLVLGQVKLLLLQMYVHLELKEQTFPRTAQPEAKLKALSDLLDKRQTAMDQTAFHTALITIFVNERDLHTIYELPTPYACYGTALPFTVDRVRDPVSKKMLLAISKITTTQGMIDHAPGLAKLSVGDIIEKYNGRDPIAQLSRIDADPGVAVELLGSGANAAARARRASEKLTFISQTMDFFPKDPGDKVQLHIRKQDGTPLDIAFPWVVIGIQSCLKPAPTPAPTAEGKAPRSTEEYETRYQEFHKPRAVSEAAPTVLGQDPRLDLSSPVSTDESILHYKVLTRQDQGQPDRQFGYLRLDSFAPTLAYEHVIDLVSGLLTHELAQTQGLIIDLRNNGGGTITFGQEMMQLFSPKAVETELFRLRVTQANHDFLEESHWADDFLKLLNDAAPGSYYTDGATLTTPALANDRGQLYFKPVAILTNSSCFSTCDMFTAGMQDNSIAKIWSEDENTGGGGANNVHYSDLIKGLPATGKFTLPALPSGQDLGIAWRQAIRVGKNAGVLLEDKGVHADRTDDLPSSAEDLALNNLITVRTITSDLLLEGARRLSVITFDDPSATTIDATEGAGDAEVPVHLAGTTRVDFLFNEQVLGSQTVDAAGAELQAIVLRIPPPTGVSEARIYLQGYLGDSPAWRKTLIYRLVPTSVAAPVSVALTGTTTPPGLAFYTPDSDPGLGWTMKSGQLQIGPGPQYADNLDTMASLFVSIPSGPSGPSGPSHLAGTSPKLSYSAKIDTEKNFDLFTVSVAEKAGETVLGTYSGNITDSSGSLADLPYAFDLSPYAGQTIEIRFHFVSDPGTHFSGVFLHNLSVE